MRLKGTTARRTLTILLAALLLCSAFMWDISEAQAASGMISTSETASANISISGNNEIKAGDTYEYTVTVEGYGLDILALARCSGVFSGSNVELEAHSVGDEPQMLSGTATITVTVSVDAQPGDTGTITVTGQMSYLNGTEIKDKSFLDSKAITVVKKPVSGVSLNRTSETIIMGTTLALSAAVSPADATYRQVTWSSSNPGVATVDAAGVVTGRGDGTAAITATADGQSATCIVRVRGMFSVSAAANSGGYGSVSGGGTYVLGASTTLTASSYSGYRFVRWIQDGYEMSRSSSITVTVSRDTAFTAEFAPLTPVGISCSKTDSTLFGGANGSITVSAWGGDSGSYEYSINGGASWQGWGSFGGLAAGTYTAVVRDTAFPVNTAAYSITVGQPPRTGIVPAKSIKSTANAGTAITVIPPAPSKGYTTTSIRYSSTNPAVAAVDSYGNVTFLAGGKATIVTTITFQTVDKRGRIKTKITTVKKSVTVKQPVATISLNIGNTTIARTQKVKLASYVAPATASNKKVKWTSSNAKVASVSSSGVVTGKAGGTAVITCRAQDGSGAVAACTVTVTPIYPAGLRMSKAAVTVKPGKTTTLKATIAPKNTDFKTVIWWSSNPGVATVDARGRVRGVAPGTATVMAATSNGIVAACTVTVR